MLNFRFMLFLMALSVSVASLYFEFVLKLMPCPLCIMQRLAVFLLTISLFGWWYSKREKWQKLFIAISLIFSSGGIFFASRQLYLQSLPADQVPACGPSLDFLIQYFPLQDIVHALFYGTGDCAKVKWTFLGGSLAFWSCMLFCFFTMVLLSQLVKHCRKSH